MTPLDWTLFSLFLAYVVWDGTRKARSTKTQEDYFLAGRSIPGWAVGLSIMATQASAITMIGTTGQGWGDGLKFLQFYFALPLAMVILAFTAVPFYHRFKVMTAYEALGVRFDEKTRVLAAVLFLVLRGLSVGFVIYAPALVLAKVVGLPLSVAVLSIGIVAVLYTSIGGLEAVIRTDVKQMSVMLLGLLVVFIVVLVKMPEGIGVGEAWTLAKEAGRLEMIRLEWDPSEKYTLWSGLLGGLFLFLSYFGTDQSQVQRLLAGRSVRDARFALLMNGVVKIPFQLLVLTVGVLLFVFYTVSGSPVSFEPANRETLGEVEREAIGEITREFEAKAVDLSEAALAVVGSEPGDDGVAADEYRKLLGEVDLLRAEATDVLGGQGSTNYVFLDFVLHHVPMGLVGLLFSAIFAAALSSIDSEIGAMTTVMMVDIAPRFRRRRGPSSLTGARIATALVGAFATGFALYAGETGSVIEAVNRVGSYLYGSLLGAFVLAVAFPFANGNGAFVGILAGVVAVAIFSISSDVAFLFLNTIGVVVVVVVGAVISLITGGRPRVRTPSS